MNFQEQIDEYLFGKLSKEETKVFQEQLLIDADLAEEVKRREVIIAGMEALVHQKMRQQIQTARKEVLLEKELENPNSTKVKKINRGWLVGVAAILAFILVAGYLFLQPKETCEELFAKNYTAFEVEFGSRDVSVEKELLQVEKFYQEKKYLEVIPILENLLKSQPTNSEFGLALGNAYLSLGKTDEAISNFETIIGRKDPLYSDSARWYLALSYLKLEKPAESKKILQVLMNDSKADFHEEAKRLLGEL